MPSELRKTVFKAMEHFARILKPEDRGLRVLEVGIDGDPLPGGNYRLFGKGNDYKTLDFLERLEPDYVADICDTKMPGNEWDIIILSQTLEHIFDYQAALKECYRMLKPGGSLIVDCPFVYEYHGLQEYDDYWRISHKAMAVLIEAIGFEHGKVALFNGILTAGIARKPK